MVAWNDPDPKPTKEEIVVASWCLRLVMMLGGFFVSGILLAIYFFSELRQPWMFLVGLVAAALSFRVFMGLAEEWAANREQRHEV